MNNKKSTRIDDSTSDEEMEISHLAFDLWQRAGRPPGQYIEYWEKAKQRIIATRGEPHEKTPLGAPPQKTPASRQARSDPQRAGAD